MGPKVLFVTSDHYPYQGACANVISNLINSLPMSKYTIDVVSPLDKSVKDERSHARNNGDDIFFDLNWFDNQTSLWFIIFKFIRFFVRKIKVLFGRLHPFYKESYCYSLTHFLDSLNCKRYDLIVSVLGGESYETEAAYRIAKKNKIPLIIYQLDPCSTNKAHSKKSLKARACFEKKVYSYANAIVTTPIIYREHKQDSFRKWMTKTFPLEFPLVVPHIYQNVTKIGKPLKCLFCGSIYNLTFAVEISKPQKKSLMMGTFRFLVSCVMN